MAKKIQGNRIYEECMFIATPTNNYELIVDFEYKGIVIPKGYRTNGANIPRVFWSIIPPFKPLLLPAIFLHDWLCDQSDYVLADKLFGEILEEMMVKRLTRNVLVYSVKIYHYWRYGVK